MRRDKRPAHPLRRAAAVVLALVVLPSLAACGTRVERDVLDEVTAVAFARPAPPAPAAGQPVAAAPDPADPAEEGAGDTVGPSAAAPPEAASPVAIRRAETVARLSEEVVGDTITIGVHLPLTGAAPMPAGYRQSLAVIERYINSEARVHGRAVRLVAEDDAYDPARGLAACRKLHADVDPLLVVGHTAPSVQEACSAYFEESGVPYFMRGTHLPILEHRFLSYFATTPDDVQGILLARYVLRQFAGRAGKVAILYESMPSAVAAVRASVAAIEDGGGEVLLVEETTPRQGDYNATIMKLREVGAELVVLAQAPMDAIKVAVQSQGSGYRPTWLGLGSHWNYNMVLEAAGSAMDGAVVLSPWASVDSPAAEELKAVYRRHAPGTEPGDLEMVMWGWMMLVRSALEHAGPELSRRSLVESLDDFRFVAPYWNPVAYSAEDRSGSTAAAVFRADGHAKRWRQVAGFSASF